MNTYQIASGLGALLLAGALTASAQTNPPAAAPAAADAKPKAKADSLFPDEVVAKAKGFEIRRSELDDAVLSIKRSLAAQNRTLTAEESAMAERQVLDRLIQVQLLLQKATDADKAKAKELADKRVDEAKARATSEESFKRQLMVSGLDEAKLRAQLTEQATAEQVLVRELKVVVTDDQVRKFYDDNPSKFEEPEKVRAAHVLIATKDMQANLELSEDQKKEKLKIAEDVLKKAKDGADFGKLAKEYSDDPGSKDKGGEYTFPRGQMVPIFEAAAFALKTNEISALITTPFGYHIIKSYERIPAKKVELDRASPDIKQYLTAQEIQKLLPDYYKKIRTEANVEIKDDNLKLVEPTEPPASAPDAAKPAAAKKDAGK
jgi:parvulin-like peptidyl-prolyl isomerase